MGQDLDPLGSNTAFGSPTDVSGVSSTPPWDYTWTTYSTTSTPDPSAYLYPWPFTTASSSSSTPSNTAAASDTQATGTGAPPPPPPPPLSSSSMSPGQIAAAVIIPILAVGAIFVLALMLLRRRRRQRSAPTDLTSDEKLETSTSPNAAPSLPPVVITSSTNNAYYTGLDHNSSRGSRDVECYGPNANPHRSLSTEEPPPPYNFKSPHLDANTLNAAPAIGLEPPVRPGSAQSTSAASITSTLYSDAASIHSARAARMSVGAATTFEAPTSLHTRSNAGSVGSNPFKSGSDLSASLGSSRHGSTSEARRSSELLTTLPTTTRPAAAARSEEGEEGDSPVSPEEDKGKDFR